MKREKWRVVGRYHFSFLFSHSSFLIAHFSFSPAGLAKTRARLFALFTFFPTLYLVYPIAQIHQKNLMPDTLADLPCLAVPNLPCLVIPNLPCLVIPNLPCLVIPNLPCLVIPNLPCLVIPNLPCLVIPNLPCLAVPNLPCLAVPNLPCLVRQQRYLTIRYDQWQAEISGAIAGMVTEKQRPVKGRRWVTAARYGAQKNLLYTVMADWL